MNQATEVILSNYKLGESVTHELHNNLVIADALLVQANVVGQQELYILGGAALALQGLTQRVTLDVDTANKLSKKVKEIIGMFVDDAASKVAVLPERYQQRCVHYDVPFQVLDVYLLHPIDLCLNKLASGRRKDIADVKHLISAGVVTRKELIDVAVAEIPPSILMKVEAFFKN